MFPCMPFVPAGTTYALLTFPCPPRTLCPTYTQGGAMGPQGGIRNTRGVKGNIRGVQGSTLRPIIGTLAPLCVPCGSCTPLVPPCIPLYLCIPLCSYFTNIGVQDEYMEAPEGVMEVQGDAREHNRNVRGTRGPQGVQRSPLYSPMSPFTLCTRGIKCVERA